MQHAPDLAPKLLGKRLCVNTGETILSYKITETEAYFGGRYRLPR